MIVYRAKNKVNGKIYVGQTIKTLNKRISEHLNDDRTPFQKAFKKYGIDSFDFCIQDECQSRAELNEREKYWISFFSCKSPNGYNLTDGGEGTIGCKPSQETIFKMSLAKKGKPSWNKGLKLKPWSPEERKKKIKGMKERYSKIPHHMNGKHHSEELKKKMSLSHVGQNIGIKNGMFGRASYMKGRNHSKDANLKNSEAHKKLWNDLNYREKLVIAHTSSNENALTRSKQSTAKKLNWQNPEYRKKQFEAHEKYFNKRKELIDA